MINSTTTFAEAHQRLAIIRSEREQLVDHNNQLISDIHTCAELGSTLSKGRAEKELSIGYQTLKHFDEKYRSEINSLRKIVELTKPFEYGKWDSPEADFVAYEMVKSGEWDRVRFMAWLDQTKMTILRDEFIDESL